MGLNCWRQSSLMSSYINFNSDCFGKEQAACSPCFSHNWKYFFFLSFNDTGTQSSLFNHHFMALDYSMDSSSIGYDKTMTPPSPHLKTKKGRYAEKELESIASTFLMLRGWQPSSVKDQAGHFSGLAGHMLSLTSIYFCGCDVKAAIEKKIIHTGLWMCSITTL